MCTQAQKILQLHIVKTHQFIVKVHLFLFLLNSSQEGNWLCYSDHICIFVNICRLCDITHHSAEARMFLWKTSVTSKRPPGEIYPAVSWSRDGHNEMHFLSDWLTYWVLINYIVFVNLFISRLWKYWFSCRILTLGPLFPVWSMLSNLPPHLPCLNFSY